MWFVPLVHFTFNTMPHFFFSLQSIQATKSSTMFTSLNSILTATERTLCCILENYQTSTRDYILVSWGQFLTCFSAAKIASFKALWLFPCRLQKPFKWTKMVPTSVAEVNKNSIGVALSTPDIHQLNFRLLIICRLFRVNLLHIIIILHPFFSSL